MTTRLCALLLACGASTPDTSTSTPESEPMITLRFQPAHSTIPAGADASTNEAARMSGAVYARLDGEAPLDLEYEAFASFQLDWLLTRSDGATFRPMFMPPPMPPPGGIPRRTLHLEPGEDTLVSTLYGGISGFYEPEHRPPHHLTIQHQSGVNIGDA